MDETSTSSASLDRQSFPEFFGLWLIEQRNLLEELVESCTEESESHIERVLVPLIERVINHYEHYYNTKTEWAKLHVFATLHPSWMSDFEDAFLWIGGWRPSTAFQLFFSKSGIQLEASLSEFLEGLQVGDLRGIISAAQLHEINVLQVRTIKEEGEITEKMAKLQDKVADRRMVEWSHSLSEMLRTKKVERVVEGDRVDSSVGLMEVGLVEILKRADELRLRTLKEVIRVLSPIQSVYFLIAAAELHLRIHDLGKSRDDIQADMEKQPRK